MNKTTKYFLCALMLAFPISEIAAQVDSNSKTRSGSFYSLFGVGFPTDNNNARELGMGIIGVSLDNSRASTLNNPAFWGKNRLATASSGFNYTSFGASNQNSSNTNALLEAGYIQLTLPFYKEKLGMSASMYSVTRSNYRFVNIDSAVVAGNNTVEYASDVRGAGGINKLEFGLGWAINNNIAVGYAPSLTFITQNNSQDVFFNQSGYGTSNLDSRITGSTMGHKFGALLSFHKLFNDTDLLNIGGAATLGSSIEAERDVTVVKEINNQEQIVPLSDIETGTIELPASLSAGISYYPNNMVNFSAEGLFEGWSSYSSPFDNDNGNATMRDRVKLGFGAEYHPYKFNSPRLLSKFRYSGGVSYDSGHLTINNEDINTLWFSAGLGIISPRSNSTVNMSLRYGLRGTSDSNLVKENIWAFNLSINLSELMFFRQKLN